ncbi:hypothetical protein [Spirosoma sp. 48-14]|uniref:hypothetical protein n=1 Tax=Spirosoma sp. 48-14 TaxID=1895854 RepID=UPI000967F241|nr:hypothetical protein [Spirosoma sp. 48-14]OJW75717.1 MAG: hypothetical protein BGO59_09130 [Spirosoma sp. 48-14]
MAQNTIIDLPTTLNLQGFLGNSLTLRITVLGDAAMPDEVKSEARYSAYQDKLPSSLQPAISVSGRVITLVYPASLQFPEGAFHQIRFDGRVVLAGTLQFSKGTLSRATMTDIAIQTNSAVEVALTVAPFSYRIGDVRSLDGTTLERWTGTEWETLNINTGTPAQTNFGLPGKLPLILN